MTNKCSWGFFTLPCRLSPRSGPTHSSKMSRSVHCGCGSFGRRLHRSGRQFLPGCGWKRLCSRPLLLNDRGSATTDEQEHQRELESIQQKIITNLIQVSGDDHIDEKYEVITLNTKRAWTGIQKGKQLLVEKSGIRALQLRLENLLRENGALQWLSTSLSTLKELLEEATDELQKQLGNEEYAEQKKKLMDEYKLIYSP